MNPVGRALWYIESHFSAELSLEEIATLGGVSRFHMTRAFSAPIKMDETPNSKLQPPRFVDGKLLLIAGLGERYDCDSSAAIPAQWQRFLPHFGRIPGQVGKVAYGVCCNGDDTGNFDYICGVEVKDFSGLPHEWSRLRIPPQRYAVFAHEGHISTIRGTWSAIWNEWLPNSGQQRADAPDFERYGENFDSASGSGGLEIWIPVKS
jgi:AraC family transcriptional regulator